MVEAVLATALGHQLRDEMLPGDIPADDNIGTTITSRA